MSSSRGEIFFLNCFAIFCFLILFKCLNADGILPKGGPEEEANLIKLLLQEKPDDNHPYLVLNLDKETGFSMYELDDNYKMLQEQIQTDGEATQTQKEEAMKSTDWGNSRHSIINQK